MSFVSVAFLVFLLAVLAGTRLLPAEKRWLLLLPASWFFYACETPWLLSLLLTTTVVSYLCALALEQAQSRRSKRRLLALGGTVCLGLLFVFKYLNFALGGVVGLLGLFGVRSGFGGIRLLLPVGISFYTFQTLSYLIDVYRGTVPAERHFGRYALFVSFFPQLVAGPIERPGDLLPQLTAPQLPDRAQTREGICLLVRGFAKKVMIADTLAACVDAAYGAPSQAGGCALALATILFAVQIYCDFSGYSDIALGSARLLGVRLSVNFDRPYAAVTIRDFWRRWHISLTRWFTDYLYIPLGGSRRGRLRQCLNILIVFAVSGLWHGADVTFLVWGSLHGLYLAAETLLDRGHSVKHPLLRHALTLTLVCFAWIFFRADGWANAAEVLRVLFSAPMPAHWLTGLGMDAAQALAALGLAALLPMLEKLPAPDEQHGAAGVLLYFLLITAMLLCRLMLLHQGGSSAFIYFRF